MKRLSLALGILASLATTGALAQSVDLTGVYRCIQVCRGDLPAYITQWA